MNYAEAMMEAYRSQIRRDLMRMRLTGIERALKIRERLWINRKDGYGYPA